MKSLKQWISTALAMTLTSLPSWAQSQVEERMKQLDTNVQRIGWIIIGIMLFIGVIKVAQAYSSNDQGAGEKALKSWGTLVGFLFVAMFVVRWVIEQGQST